MTIGQVINLIRQYADAALRKRKSYTLQVNTVLAAWDKAVDAGTADEAEKERLKAHARSVAEREYGRVDPAFMSRDAG